MQLLHQVSPVTVLHRLRLELTYQIIDLLVVLYDLAEFIEEHGSLDDRRGLLHLNGGRIQQVFHLLVDIGTERGVIDRLYTCRPDLLQELPTLTQDVQLLLQTVQAFRVTQLHLEQFLGLADSDPLCFGSGDFRTDGREYVKGTSRQDIALFWLLILPLQLDVFDLLESHSFLIDDFFLELWDFFLHDLGLLSIKLFESGPLSLYQLDVEPLLRELVPLRYKKLVTRLVLLELLTPNLV